MIRTSFIRCLAILLAVFLLPISALMEEAAAPKGLKRAKVLDESLSLLEEGNVFLKKYNALTEAGLTARYPQGLPYFFGGRDEELLFKIMEAWQDSGHFKVGRNYVYGYDCIGFTRQVYKKSGLPHPDTISEMLQDARYAAFRVDVLSHPYPRWREILSVGDMLAIRGKTYNHIMIFVGTLGDFGFTREELGDTLYRYRDFPLVIHTAENPWAIARNRRHIDSLNRTLPIFDTDGGVHVAILGVPLIQAPHTVTVDEVTSHAFDVRGTYLPVYDLSQKLSVVGWRLKAEPAPKATPAPAPGENALVELREGMEHPLVNRLKQRLYDLGYYRNNIVNELYTADTAKYIREVQRINLLEQTGVATVEFLEFFFSDAVMPYYTPKP